MDKTLFKGNKKYTKNSLNCTELGHPIKEIPTKKIFSPKEKISYTYPKNFFALPWKNRFSTQGKKFYSYPQKPDFLHKEKISYAHLKIFLRSLENNNVLPEIMIFRKKNFQDKEILIFVGKT